MRALAILCVVPAFSLGLIAGVTHIVGPLEPSAQQTNLVWANRVFTTRNDFETWLASRGSNYELWSQRHPVAARHFDDASPSLAASASAQDSRRQSRTALLITIISCSVLLAMLALPRLVRSARYLLEPPKGGPRLRGQPSKVVAAVASRAVESRAVASRAVASRSRAGAGSPRWSHAPATPRSAVSPETLPLDWRRRWTALGRFGRIDPGRVAMPVRTNSRLVRHHLPRVMFYATVVVLSFAIGAWIAIYLQ
jgi:hypothetical protein